MSLKEIAIKSVFEGIYDGFKIFMTAILVIILLIIFGVIT